MKYLESFWNHSKVDTDKLYKYLDLEIPNNFASEPINKIEVNTTKKSFYTDLLHIILHTDDKKIIFTYPTSGKTIKKSFCKIKIGDENWVLRSDSSGLDGDLQELVHHELMKSNNIFDDVDEIDSLVLKYFGLLPTQEVGYEEEEEEEEED